MEIGDLLYVGLVLVVTGIVLAFGADVQGDIADDFDANSYEANISDNSLEGSANLSERFGTIGTIAAIVVVVGLLMTGFGVYMRR